MSLIFRSATRSRSIVVTPGATASLTLSSTRRTMRPLRRIFSISAADLQTIDILYRTKRLRCNRFHRLVAVEFHQPPLGMVVVHQRKRQLLVGLQAFGDNFY